MTHSLDSKFAGVYLDSEGNINVNVVGGPSSEKYSLTVMHNNEMFAIAPSDNVISYVNN